MNSTDGRRLRTVETTIDVLGALRELDGGGVTAVAEHAGISKASAHHHLSTLRANHLVAKAGDEYRLGLQFATLGEYVKNHTPLYAAGRGEIDRLAEETGEFAHLLTEQFGRAIHLYKSQGEKAVGKPYHRRNLQRRDHLHYSAAGKAILSRLPDARVEEIVHEYGLPERTERTITDRTALLEALETVRERGYAINDEEEIPGLRAVAAPVDPDRGDTIGAVSVSGPVSRMQDGRFGEELAETVVRAANVIEVNIDTADR